MDALVLQLPTGFGQWEEIRGWGKGGRALIASLVNVSQLPISLYLRHSPFQVALNTQCFFFLSGSLRSLPVLAP